jgi:hypothetical protein
MKGKGEIVLSSGRVHVENSGHKGKDCGVQFVERVECLRSERSLVNHLPAFQRFSLPAICVGSVRRFV